jgi:hypothetical protein
MRASHGLHAGKVLSCRGVQDVLPASNVVQHGSVGPTPPSPPEQPEMAAESPPSSSTLMSSPRNLLCHTYTPALYAVNPPTTTVPSILKATAGTQLALRRRSAPCVPAWYGSWHEGIMPQTAKLHAEGTSDGVMRLHHPPGSRGAVCSIAVIAVMWQEAPSVHMPVAVWLFPSLVYACVHLGHEALEPLTPTLTCDM